MTNTSHDPLLIFVRGLPGSGKTYFTYALRDAIKETAVTVIDPDFIDKNDSEYITFTKSLETEGLDPLIFPFRWLRKCAIDASRKGALIVWNQPFTNRGVFDRLIAYLTENVKAKYDHKLKILVIEINTPTDIAWSRVEQRVNEGGHGPNKNTFNQRCAEYESYADTYPVLELNGEQDVSHLVTQTIGRIQDILA